MRDVGEFAARQPDANKLAFASDTHTVELGVARNLTRPCRATPRSYGLSPELVGRIEILGTPPRLSDLSFAEVKHPYVLTVVAVITALRGHVRQGDGMIITSGYIMELLSERSL